jgi:hypothetical protein
MGISFGRIPKIPGGSMVEQFKAYLMDEEKSELTVEKYSGMCGGSELGLEIER